MNAFRRIRLTGIILAALALAAAAPALAESRSFPGWRVTLPEGWTVAEERDADFGGNGFYRVVLQSGDSRTKLEFMAHYLPGEAGEKARLLAELYSLGAAPGRVGLGEHGYLVAGRDKGRWMALAALGPDIMISANIDQNQPGGGGGQEQNQAEAKSPNDPAISRILRSVESAEVPEKYLLVSRELEAAKAKRQSARQIRFSPPSKPGPPPEAQAKFMKLCRTGSPGEIRAALKAGADPGQGLSDLGWPAIFGYEVNGLANWKSPLIEAGQVVDIYERKVLSANWDNKRWWLWGPRPAATPLMAAAWGNPTPESLKVLLKAGADPNIVTSSRVTALGLAAAQAGPEAVKALLDGGAEIYDESNTSESALTLAARYNPDPKVTRLLLDRGAKAHPGSSRVSSPIEMAAVHNPNLEVLDLLLARLPLRQSNPYDGRPSDLAVILSAPDVRPEAVRKLLAAGAPVDEAAVVHRLSNAAVSPLTVAARYSNNPEIIKVLLAAGADPNPRFKNERSSGGIEGREGLSALSASVTRSGGFSASDRNQDTWNREITDLLIEGGAIVTMADLKLATGYYGGAASLKHLISAWKKQNPEGDVQALLNELAAEAIQNTRAPLVEALAEEGADIQAVIDENPELAFTFFTGHNGVNPKNLAVLSRQYKIDPNARSKNGQTPLTKSLDSAGNSHRNMVADILKAGADPNLPDLKTGRSPLTMALIHRWDASEQAARLLEAGADPNAPDNIGFTPLMAAAGRPDAAMLKLLLAPPQADGDLNIAAENGPASPNAFKVNVNAADKHGLDALMMASIPSTTLQFSSAKPGLGATMVPPPTDPEKVRLLLSAGADVQRRDKRGFTALAYAAALGTDPEIINLLIEAGARRDLTVGGKTLLGLAVRTNPNPAVIRRLAALGVPLTAQKSPLAQARPAVLITVRDLGNFFAGPVLGQSGWAMFQGEKKIQAALKVNDQNLDLGQRIYVAELLGLLPDDWYEYEPGEAEGQLWPLLTSAQDDPIDFYLELKAIVKAGADLEERDQSGRTPLIYAAQMFKSEMALAVIKQLLAAGAEAGARDDHGVGALMYAARFQNDAFLYREILEALIAGGADIEARDQAGHTALMQTIIFEPKADAALAKIKILHDLGADLNTRDNRGATVLINAALMREIDTANKYLFTWLMEQGVDAAAVDSDGLNAAMASAIVADGHYSDNFYAGGADPLARDRHGRDVLAHMFRQRVVQDMSGFSWKQVNPENRADLSQRDAYGLSLPEQVLFSHGSISTIKMLLDQGLEF